MTSIERYDAKTSIEIAGDAWALAQRIAKTEFVPDGLRGKPDAVLACILAGHELAISPMQSLQKIHVIKGRPALGAEMMRAIVTRSGHEIWVEESTSTRAIVKGRRRDNGREGAVTWTDDDAKRAGLMGKENWKGYPAAMLIARASSQLCRNLFPDVLAGFSYSTEELEDGFELEQLTPTSPIGAPSLETGTSTARARRTATRGADTPDKTEPDVETRAPREEAPLPGEDGPDSAGNAVGGNVIDTKAREPDAVFDTPPAGEGRDPIGDDYTDAGPDFDESARRPLSGPQQIAIQFSNRKITDRGDRLRICSLIIGRDIESGNDLTTDEISTVLGTLADTPLDGTLPGEEAGPVESSPEPPGPAASPDPEPAPRARRSPSTPEPTGDPEEWDVDRWRAFIASRGVKASELLREAQRLAAEISLVPPETIDGIVGFGIAQDLVGYCEDAATERRPSS